MRNHPDVKLPVEIGLGANGSQVSRSRLHQIKEVCIQCLHGVRFPLFNIH